MIPKVVSVIKETRLGSEKGIRAPLKCPSCREKVLRDEDKVRYYCPNTENCPDQIKDRFAYIVGK